MDWNNCWVKSKVWLTLDLKTSIIRSSLCDYSDTYILVKGTITAPNTVAAGAIVNDTHKKVIFKVCAPFTDCITKNRNIQEGEAQRIDVVMPKYNGEIDFSDNNNSASFKFKQQIITGQTGNDGTKNVEITVSLKYLSNLWRKLEMSLINCEISLQLKWFKKCITV